MSNDNVDDVSTEVAADGDIEESSSLSVEDDPEGTTDPAELAGTGDDADADVS